MTDPMTASGDMIYNSAAGDPAALPIGDAYEVLTVSGGLPIWNVNNRMVGFALSDETTALTTGQKLATDWPRDYIATRVYGSVVTAASGSNIEVDLEDEGYSMLNSVLSFATGANNVETSSFTGGATSYTIHKGDLFTGDIDQIGSSVAGAGLKIYLDGYWI
jgi:hypothetical protein